jgi:hypothetical protein
MTNSVPRRVRMAMAAKAVLVLLTLSIAFVRFTGVNSDSEWYFLAAEGHSAAVIKPFSSRILYPAAVRLLRKVAGLSTAGSFLALGAVASAGFVAVNCLIIQQATNGRMVLPWLCLPAIVELLRQYFLPDLPHAAEVAVFFLLLSKRCFIASLAVLFAAQLTRDSTVLLAVVAACVFWRDSKRAMAVATLLTCGLGIAVAAIVASGGRGNEHGLGTIQYLALKVPFNLTRNVFGLEFWSNTLGGQPAFSINLPHWLHIGAIRRIGFAAFVPMFPLKTFLFALTAFGFAPAVVARELWRRWRNRKTRLATCDSLPLWLMIALYYGVAAFLIAPCLGASVSRLFCYAWPAFVLATPAILWRCRPATGVDIGALPRFRLFVAAHFLVPWLQWAVDLLAPFDWAVVISSLLAGAALQVWALHQLGRFDSTEVPPGTGAASPSPRRWSGTLSRP